MNVIKWKAPLSGPIPVVYKIYRDPQLTHLIDEVSAYEKLKFVDHNRREHHIYTYFIISVDELGNTSAPIKVTIHEENSSQSKR